MMTTADELLALEAESKTAGPSPEDLAKAIKLAAEQALLLDEIERLERQLKIANDKLRANVERQLPDALAACQLIALPTNYGTVELETKIVASPRKEAKAEIVEWVEAHGREDLVKTVLDLRFARGEHKMLKKLLSIIRGFPAFKGKITVEPVKSVHAQSLSKFVRDWTKAEVNDAERDRLPRELFGYVELKRAELKRGDMSLTRHKRNGDEEL